MILLLRASRPLRTLHCTLLLAALAGCAASPRLQEAREVAADAVKLGGYADLSERFRETYHRERPYLTAAADARERTIDAQRRAAYADITAIHDVVVQYLRSLALVAGANTFSLDAPIKALGAGIKAWPDAGLEDRHVNAFTGLARLMARAATARQQENALQLMVHDAEPHLQLLLDAMQRLLRYYDKSSDNERAIVLGMLDVEIPFAETPRDRLLAALAKAHRQTRAQEYRVAGLRHTLAIKHVAAIAAAHTALLQRLEQPDNAAAGETLRQASGALRLQTDALTQPLATQFATPLEQP
ncbi:MAG: hypothetical protein K2X55_15520 [Burkholderiaceae bacterium]|nr:hypothetical protein [Burkholderiaceae bacterium]